MSTTNAAVLIHRKDLGTLCEGAIADVAVMRLREGNFGLDASNTRLNGKHKLQCELTLLGGDIVWDLNGLAGHDVDLAD